MTTPAASLPARVMAFFRAEPDEQLTADDIALKFNTQRKNVHTQLASAVEAGHLKRDPSDEHGYVYASGSSLLKQAKAEAKQAAQPKKPRQPKADVDLRTLPIATDIPLPTLRRAQQHAPEALDRLTQPGHSFAVPLDASGISALRKAITDRHNAGTQRYVARALETEFRVWRTA